MSYRAIAERVAKDQKERQYIIDLLTTKPKEIPPPAPITREAIEEMRKVINASWRLK